MKRKKGQVQYAHNQAVKGVLFVLIRVDCRDSKMSTVLLLHLHHALFILLSCLVSLLELITDDLFLAPPSLLAQH